MLSENERNKLEYRRGHGCENINLWIDEIKKSNNVYFLLESAQVYHWNDGMSLPMAIIKHPMCDLGTALYMFWTGECLSYYLGESTRNEYNNDRADYCELLAEKLLNQSFKLGPISFDPGINRVWLYKYRKMGVPEVFYTPVVGIHMN